MMTLLIGALVGAILTLGTKGLEEGLFRRRRRKSIATALLDDLRSIEWNARYLSQHPLPAGRGGAGVNQIFVRVAQSDDLFLFKPETVSRILGLVAVLTDVEEAIVDFRESKGAETGLHGTVRTKAFFVAGRVADLKELLVKEGGTLPPMEELQTVDPDHIPALPPQAFREWETPTKL